MSVDVEAGKDHVNEPQEDAHARSCPFYEPTFAPQLASQEYPSEDEYSEAGERSDQE